MDENLSRAIYEDNLNPQGIIFLQRPERHLSYIQTAGKLIEPLKHFVFAAHDQKSNIFFVLLSSWEFKKRKALN